MLIKVFGIWLMLQGNAVLHYYQPPTDEVEEAGCSLDMGVGINYYFKNKTCNQVAEEINRQIKESK